MLYTSLIIANLLLVVCNCISINMIRQRNKAIISLLDSMPDQNVRLLSSEKESQDSSFPYDHEMEENFQQIIEDFDE
jgi:hypothetical protein